MKKIAILTPLQSRLSGIYYWFDLLGLLFKLAEKHQIQYIWDDSVAHLADKRNLLTMKALKMKADYLLWLDGDMRFDNDIFEKLSSHNKDIISGVYVDRFGNVINKLKNQEPIPIERLRDNKLIETESTGMGCILMKSKIFKKIKKPWFIWKDNKCEDWNFCIKARKIGLKVYTDPEVYCSHGFTINKKRDIYKFLLYGRY